MDFKKILLLLPSLKFEWIPWKITNEQPLIQAEQVKQNPKKSKKKKIKKSVTEQSLNGNENTELVQKNNQ